jgi:hypothetical protein
MTSKKLLILLVGFASVRTVKATVIADLIVKGLPVKVLSSGKSYKVFEQYPWEGHSSKIWSERESSKFQLWPGGMDEP